MPEPRISPRLERLLVIQMAESVNTWERHFPGVAPLIARGSNGITVYGDGAEQTNDYGMTYNNWRRNVPGQRNATVQQFANMTRAQAYDYFDEDFRQWLRVDDLPIAIQGQMMNYAIHRPGHTVGVLCDVLQNARDAQGQPYLPRGQRSVTVTPAIAEAAERYYEDVGAIGFNNAYAEARADKYDRLGGRYERAFMRRAREFRMDMDIGEARAAGFRIERNDRGQEIALMPEVVAGPNGRESVRMPDNRLVPYEQWYGEFMLDHSNNNGIRSRAMTMTVAPSVDGQAVAQVAARGLSPEQEHRGIISDRGVVRALQQRLKDEGYYRGEVDGVFGRISREAWQNYERDHQGFSTNGGPRRGFTADGFVTAQEVQFVVNPGSMLTPPPTPPRPQPEPAERSSPFQMVMNLVSGR